MNDYTWECPSCHKRHSGKGSQLFTTGIDIHCNCGNEHHARLDFKIENELRYGDNWSNSWKWKNRKKIHPIKMGTKTKGR